MEKEFGKGAGNLYKFLIIIDIPFSVSYIYVFSGPHLQIHLTFILMKTTVPLRFILGFILMIPSSLTFAQVGINSNNDQPDASSMLDVKSTNKGLLPPRMSTTQMNSIASPAQGLLVYNTDFQSLYWFNGTIWKRFNDVSYTETDPIFLAHPSAGITTTLIGNWNTAYSNRITGASGTAPLTLSLSANLLTGSITQANAATNGYLSWVDWNTFNNKVSSQWVTNGQDIFYSAGRVGIGTASPATSAALELSSTSRGFLPPRMTMAQRNAIATPANGLMIYQTDNTPGYYYNSGSSASPVWVTVGTGSGWSLTGNSGTSSTTNFIGTTDNVPLVFRVNNQKSGIVDHLSSNTSLGYQSLLSITTGKNNVAFGACALYRNTTISNLVAIGDSALYNNGLGEMGDYATGNTAVGSKALYANTSGHDNTALGYKSIYSNTTGHSNTAIGSDALYFNTTGIDNTACGHFALQYNSAGLYNDAFGYGALRFNTTGSYNTAIGNRALSVNTTGESNIAIGTDALLRNSANSRSTAIGICAMQYADNRTTNGRATFNTALGCEALSGSAIFADNTGQYNTAVGDQALLINSSGNSNTAVGYTALVSNTTGSNNSALGYKADVVSAGLTNATAIGAFSQAGASNSLVLGSIAGVNGASVSANVGIGTSTPSAKLDVIGTVKITDGTQGADKVLASDASGLASWQSQSGKYIQNQSATDQAAGFRINGNGIFNGGNVGIGTTNPGTKLEVNGMIYSSTGGIKFPDHSIQTYAYDSTRVWGIRGNFLTDSSSFLGTISDHPLEMRVYNNRVFRLEPNANCPNIIGGYKYNKVTPGFYGATISGGGFQFSGSTDNSNEILGSNFGTVGGGMRNKVTGGDYSTIGGGNHNTTTGIGATISGGKNNVSGFLYAAVGGGSDNTSQGLASFVGGGQTNNAQADWSVVAGGGNNHAGAWASVVGGGSGNESTGQGSTVPGGYFNTAAGDYSFAAGYKAKALHKGTYVWCDSNSAVAFSSTANFQYLIRAAGGVGINTNTPTQKLHVDNGNILAEGLGSFDAAAEQAILYLGNTNHFIKSEYGYGLKLGTTSIADALTIRETSGNVGIGTTDPIVKLDIKGINNAATLLRINQIGTDAYAGTRMDRDDVEKWFIGMEPSTQNLIFRRTASVNDVTFDNTGNVGIGATPSFTHRLTVYNPVDDNVLRLMGPDGTYQYGARLNFGDGDLVYFDEDEDHKLTIFGNGRTAIMGGNVGIGTLTPGAKLAVYNGTTTGTYTTTGWMHSSDARLKSNIAPIEDALGKVLELKGVYFNWKNDDEKRQVGFIAQDVEPVLPEVVGKDDEGTYSMSYGGVVPVLVEAIKELKSQNDDLLSKLKELENKIARLEQK